MIPQQTLESYPVFSDNGTKVKPDDAKYAAGWAQADVVPAEWLNWFFNKNSKGITLLNAGVDSIEKEIISVLTEYGISPDDTKTNQLLTAIKKLAPQVTSCTSAASAATKEISVTGSVLKAGNIYVVAMTNGNTYGDGSVTYPSLSINGGTAYPMCDSKGAYLKSGAWKDGETITLVYDGTKYLKFSSPVDEIGNGNPYAVTSNAVSCIMATGTTITGPKLTAGGNIKIMWTADLSGADASTGLSLTYNGSAIDVKINKEGTLSDFTAAEVSSGTYKYIQAHTTLPLVYDGTRFIIVGNPVVLAGEGWSLHADGKIDKDTEFLVTVTGDNPSAQSGTTYAYNIGPNFGIKEGDVIKVTFTQALQSSSAITKVSLTCGGKTGDIVTTQPDTSVTNAPAAGYKWVASHEFTGGNYSATYKHKVWDDNTTLELMWTGTYWLVDSDTVVCSYTSSTQSYLIKTNGLIKQWGTYTQSSARECRADINLYVKYSNLSYCGYAVPKATYETALSLAVISGLAINTENMFRCRINGNSSQDNNYLGIIWGTTGY